MVHEALGHIIHRDPSVLCDRAQIENAFVRDAAGAPGVENWVGITQARGDIIRGTDGHLGRPA